MSVVNFPGASGGGPIQTQHSGGGGGNGLEARMAKVEADVGHIKTVMTDIKGEVKDIRKEMREDFRILFGCLIAGALGLAFIMAKGFHWL